MKTVLVADPTCAVLGASELHWIDSASEGGEVHHIDPTGSAHFADQAALLEDLEPDLVVVSGPTGAELLAYARFRGFRVAYLMEWVEGQTLGSWTDPASHLPFLAHWVFSPGLQSEQVLTTGEGATQRVIPLREGTPATQLQLIRELATTQRPEVDQLPNSGSTWNRLVEQVQLRAAIQSGDRPTEFRILRTLARQWALQEGGEDPLQPRSLRSRPRVLLVSHDLTKTGAPMALLWILRAWIAAETPWELWVMGLDDGPMEELFRAEVGERFLKVSTRNPEAPYAEALQAVDEIAPDLVLLNGSPIYPLVPLLAWKGLPIAWWYHEGLNVAKRDGHLFTTRSLEGLVRYTQALPARVLTASVDTVEQLELFCPAARGRVGMIPYGFTISTVVERGAALRERRAALRAELGLTEECIVFVCVGSLEKRKNQLRLVQAFQQLADRQPSAVAARLKLLFVGNLDPDGTAPDNYHAELVAAVRPEHEDKVQILGPQPSAYPHMVAADAQVLVSTNECSPLVNIESILLGTYVVSSRVHGIPELIEDGVRGTLVEPESTDDIARGLEVVVDGVLHHPDNLQERREAAFAFASAKHDVRRVADRFRSEIENILHSTAALGGLQVLGAGVNEYLQRALVQRWTLVKHDVANEAHIVRGHCHHFYDATVMRPSLVQAT